MVSRAVDGGQGGNANLNIGMHLSPDKPRLVLIVLEDCPVQLHLADAILEHREGSVVHLADACRWIRADSDVTVALIEVGSPFLAEMSQKDFYDLKAMIQKATNLLWLTSTGDGDTFDPQSQISTGLFQTVLSESPTRRVSTLSIEVGGDGLVSRDMATSILQVLEATRGDRGAHEREFRVKDNMLHTARIRAEPKLQSTMQFLATEEMRHEPWLPGRSVVLQVGAPGMLDTLQYVEDSSFYSSELGAEEVEIKATAWAVNFRDALAALGRLEGEELGFECVGEVIRSGPSCQDFQVGDRVVMVRPGCFRTYVRGPGSVTFKIPDGWSYEDAVSAINPGATAYHCLVTLARLQRGEKILIHSATGSTGQMAVRLARSIGAEVFVTVGSPSKKRLLTEEFGIPSDHVFYSRNTSFAQGIMRMTGGAGVDVVLNSLSGQSLRATWECVAPFGRFLELGKADINTNASLPMAPFRGNVSFFAVDLKHLTLAQPKIAGAIYRKVMELLVSKVLDFPTPRHVFAISELENAIRMVQAGRHAGRVIAMANDGDD
ncbi:hypothetical protein GGR56DRAFT_160663 [Xylariaceae sp. FL0804]|nr:hypothetical protein GGR56DRAFT_160663 [Xylariaceae sp. FL0804]